MFGFELLTISLLFGAYCASVPDLENTLDKKDTTLYEKLCDEVFAREAEVDRIKP